MKTFFGWLKCISRWLRLAFNYHNMKEMGDSLPEYLNILIKANNR